jgi:hypothetical protein
MTKKRLSAHSERLWLNLQSSLLDFHKTLIEIIENMAWKPAYETFTDAWTAKMSNISFAPELLPHIMYQMFNEGATVEDVADAVKGVGPDAVERVKQQKDNDVPAEYVHVRDYHRKPPARPATLHVNVGQSALTQYNRIAKKLGMTVEDIAREAIARRFRTLGRRG